MRLSLGISYSAQVMDGRLNIDFFINKNVILAAVDEESSGFIDCFTD